MFILVSQGMNTVFRSCIIVAFVFLYVIHCNGTRYEVHTAPLSLHSRTPIHVPWVADLISNVTYNKSITELNPNLHMFVNSVLLHIDDGNFQNISEYECIYWVTVYDVRGRNRTELYNDLCVIEGMKVTFPKHALWRNNVVNIDDMGPYRIMFSTFDNYTPMIYNYREHKYQLGQSRMRYVLYGSSFLFSTMWSNICRIATDLVETPDTLPIIF